jgi:soluble lytic murein transglycosylase-like protein
VYKRKRVDAAEKAATAKKERDKNRIETIMAVEGKPYIKMVSFYDNEKASLLNADSNGYF